MTIVISNNCPNGPKEFFKELDYPLVSNNFKDENEFSEKIKSFLNNEKNFEKFKLSLLKKTKDYTVYQHCKKLSEILSKWKNNAKNKILLKLWVRDIITAQVFIT